MRTIQTHVITFCMLVIIVTSSTRAQKSPPMGNNHELSIAIEEMEKANYFSFAMLINMLQTVNPRFLANVTFLMPKDKTLARSNIIQQDSVTEFLLRHSIPSPLLFEHLNLIPNGSLVPSSLPHYTLEISNGGRLNYFLNNVKIISRDICTLGSIKCHGINGILTSPSERTRVFEASQRKAEAEQTYEDSRQYGAWNKERRSASCSMESGSRLTSRKEKSRRARLACSGS